MNYGIGPLAHGEGSAPERAGKYQGAQHPADSLFQTRQASETQHVTDNHYVHMQMPCFSGRRS